MYNEKYQDVVSMHRIGYPSCYSVRNCFTERKFHPEGNQCLKSVKEYIENVKSNMSRLNLNTMTRWPMLLLKNTDTFAGLLGSIFGHRFQ